MMGDWERSNELMLRALLNFLVQVAGSSETWFLFSSVVRGAAQSSRVGWKCHRSKFWCWAYGETLHFMENEGTVLFIKTLLENTFSLSFL